jgi:hypothetical protein
MSIPVCSNLSENIGGSMDAAMATSESAKAAAAAKLNSQFVSNKPISPLKVNTSPFHAPNTPKLNSNPSMNSTGAATANNSIHTPRFHSKEHKILTTNFDRPPTNHLATPQPIISSPAASACSSSLVANAESTLNSLINSLNQIDYSYLNKTTTTTTMPIAEEEPQKSNTHNNLNIDELKSENELMQSMIERLMEENAQLRAEKMLLTSSSNTTSTTHDNDIYSKVKNFSHHHQIENKKPSIIMSSSTKMELLMPSKDSVIKKMKKITRSVQELFKATKESHFGSLKYLGERVCQCVHEMISLFPNGSSCLGAALHENLCLLDETCRTLADLIEKNSAQIDMFVVGESVAVKTLSVSSSASSALSSSTPPVVSGDDEALNDTMVIKTMIVSNLVTCSYEIAHTVKRIVCIMDAEFSD